jgi:ribonuclease-3
VTDEERIAALTERLGLPAGSLNPELALQALRHGSYANERAAARERSNERLEFLGDAVLGFVIARRFYDLLPDAPEGDLTRLRASVVREESLALAGRQIGLGELLLLGRAEQRSGVRENPGRLADALEAVLAAVYLSCGLDRAQEVLERLLAPVFETASVLAHDPKTELQQTLQSRRRNALYHVLAVNGPPHARSYEVEVRIDATPLGRGAGKSKKEAEQAAARAALADTPALERALIDEPVSVEPPDERWPALAREEMARLKGALPEAQFEHIGSTAVPGLPAKPIVDLMAGVSDLAAPLRVPDYEACGEAGVPGRLYFRRRDGSPFNLMVTVFQGPLWRDALLLRDHLRAHPDAKERYATAKRAVLAAGANTLLAYSDAKSAAVSALIEEARGHVESSQAAPGAGG